jgi:hypothetical protein
MPNPTTLVTFLLDRSGSMSSCKEATIEAFNGYLAGLQDEQDANIELTFLQFDSVSLDKVCVAEPVKSVSPLTPKTFEPRASTPLIDSCVKTINAVAESLTKRDDQPKVVICFQTDGHENCSTQHTWNELNALIKEKSALGWQFNFMGAGVDAYANAKLMGMSGESAMSYDQTNLKSTRAAFAASAVNTASYAAGRTGNTQYSAQQRMSAGDRFAPADLRQPAPNLTKKPDEKKPVPLVDNFSL